MTNYSVHNAIALVDVAVPRSRDIDKLIERIGAAALRAAERDDNAVQQPQVLGVQSMSANDVTIRVICECKPHTADSVMRKLNEEIRRSLDTNRESEADQP